MNEPSQTGPRRRTISTPTKLDALAVQMQHESLFGDFSEFVNHLMREEAVRRGLLSGSSIVQDHPPSNPTAPGTPKPVSYGKPKRASSSKRDKKAA